MPKRRPIGSKGVRSGYIKIKTINGWNYEHILIAENKYGRKIKNDEEVHHLDENRLNNNPDNIVIWKKHKHQSYHSSHRSKETINKMKGNRPSITGENNPMYGIHKCGKDNPLYGRKATEETKKKMRLAWIKRKERKLQNVYIMAE